VSRPTPLLARISLTVLTLVAAGLLLRADDPAATASALTPPPGYKLVYHDIGGKKVPLFVKNQLDMSGLVRRMEDDPLDHQKAFSAASALGNKTFLVPGSGNWNQTAGTDGFVTKVYDTTQSASVYNLGSKSTYRTSSYDGLKAVAGYDQSFATKTADVGQDQNAAAQFAAIGAPDPDQSRAVPIPPTPYPASDAPYADADKTFQGPEEDARHRHLTRLKNGQLLVEQIPDRPLSIDEVKNLINHGFKPNTDQPAPPASKPLNDPNYQPEPIRIEPTSADDAPPSPASTPSVTGHKDDDDANDPVPSPGTMAEPPENSEPLPSK
jgi:hypothetical protein